MTLSPKLEALAMRVAQLVLEANQAQRRPVLTRAEARAYVGKESDSAFDRWAAAWHVVPCAHGRYARGHLDRALEREAKARPIKLPARSLHKEAA